MDDYYSFFSARSSKSKIRASSCTKNRQSLLHDEARVLIFDDLAEENGRQRNGSESNTDFGVAFIQILK
jgi:hypothetical protein